MPSTALSRSPHLTTVEARVTCSIQALVKDRRGAAAVEFALVSSMLIFTIMFIMTIGLILYLNQVLDYATTKAARQIMIGAVQKAGTSQSNFRTQVVCSYLPAAMNCSDVIVNVQTLSEAAQPGGYYSFIRSDQRGLSIPALSNGSAQYSVGVQSSYVYMQVIYPITFLPSFISNLLSGGATYNGVPAYLAVSTAAFRNENY